MMNPGLGMRRRAAGCGRGLTAGLAVATICIAVASTAQDTPYAARTARTANRQSAAARPLIVGGDQAYPPFEFLDDRGQPAGFAVDIMRAVAREAGLAIEIRLGRWGDMVAGLDDGEIDVMQGMLYSPERDMLFDFTQPYLVIHYVAVVRQAAGHLPRSPDDLRGLRLVVQEGDIMHDYAIENGLENQLSLTRDQDEALRQLAGGLHDCALVGRVIALRWLEHNPTAELKVGRQPLLSPGYAFAVANGRDVLLARLSDGLAAIRHSGEYRRIYEQWMAVYEPKPPTFLAVVKYAAIVILPLLAIAVFAVFWSWSLRRQVAQRTAELRDSSEMQRAMLACLPVALFSIDADGRVLSWNTSAERMFGWTAEEVIGKRVPIVPEDKQEEFDTLRQQGLTGGGFIGKELIRRRKDGSDIPLLLSTSPIHSGNSDPVALLAAALDISERKHHEERVAHLNRVLRAIRDINQLIVRESDPQRLIDQACRLLVQHRGFRGAWIVLVDSGGRMSACAAAAMKTDELERLMAENRLPPCCAQLDADNPLHVIEADAQACAECAIDPGCEGVALWCAALTHGDHVFGYLAVRGESRMDADAEEKELFAEVAGDLGYALHGLATRQAREQAETERRSMQQQLHQSQKLESIGRLAGGIAHDYNNLLMGIMNYVELCRDEIDPQHPIRKWLDEIAADARRSADLTRQLLAFARKQTIDPKPLDLNEALEGMLNMLRRLVGEDIDLAWRHGVNLWPVKLDTGQIHQVLANLCVNARDAIHGAGKLTIETANATIDREYCATHPDALPGPFVVLAVSDDGCGMDRDTLAHAFEPFFTTKEQHQGTGLGLATVYGIAKQNNGFVNAYSEVGQGTTIRVYLPRYEGTHRPETTQRRTTEPEIDGRETLLLVEDEKAIRYTTHLFLERAGYTVIQAESADDALDKVARLAHAIDLLITDVVMPGMSGRDLAEKLAAKYPDMKCLFISGYTANVIAHRGVLDDDVEFLQKPFSRDEITRKVREMLDNC